MMLPAYHPRMLTAGLARESKMILFGHGEAAMSLAPGS
jgi:hypothetical protein